MITEHLRGTASGIAIAAVIGVALAAHAARGNPLSGEIPPSAALVEDASPLSTAAEPAQDAPAAEDDGTAEDSAAEDETAEEEDAAAQEDTGRDDSVRRAGLALTGAPVNLEPGRSLTLTLSQTAMFDSNVGLDDDGEAFSLGYNAGLSYTMQTPRTTFVVSSGLNLNLRTGGGVDSDESFSFGLPSLELGAQHALDRTTSVSGFVNARVTEVDFTDPGSVQFIDSDGDGLLDSIEIDPSETRNAQQVSVSSGLSLTETINRTTSLTAGLGFTRVDYIDGGRTNTPYLSLRANAGLNLQLGRDLSGGVSTNLSSYTGYSATADESVTASVSGNLRWQADNATELNGSLGPSVTFSDRNGVTPGLRATAGIRFLGPNEQLSLGFSNGVAPTNNGVVRNVTALQMQASHRVTQTSNVTVSSGLSLQTPLGSESGSDSTFAFTAGTSYGMTLPQQVQANVGYRFRTELTDDESPMSHQVYLSLSKSLDFLP